MHSTRAVEAAVDSVPERRKRWHALSVLCLGVLMIMLNTTAVNVALPSIQQELQINQTELVWVSNAYMFTYGSFLLLSARLGDIYGHRKLFLLGIALFTLASLLCGASENAVWLVAGRALQGFGGAAVLAVALSLTLDMFRGEAERAKALGAYSFVTAGGGGVGLVIGGALTSAFGWHAIFLADVALGIATGLLCMSMVPPGLAGRSRIRAPLFPVGVLQLPNVGVALAISVLWATAVWAWYFIAALYMQQVLGYRPMHIALAFLPLNVLGALCSLAVSARLVARFGVKVALGMGLSCGTLGFVLFALLAATGAHALLLQGMVILGMGTGIAYGPLLMAATRDFPPAQSGLASGIINTTFMMGGAVGVALLANLAAITTEGLRLGGEDAHAAMVGGYHAAFVAAAGCAGLAVLLCVAGLRIKVGGSAP